MSGINVKIEVKPEPSDFSFPPPSSRPSASSTSTPQSHFKPEPSSSTVPAVKSEPGTSPVDRKRSRGASPVPSAPSGWVESPEAARKRLEARERDRITRENRKNETLAEKRRRLSQPKPEKKPPSAYNIYMKEKLVIVSLGNPGMTQPEKFKIVAESWKFSLKNPKNVVRPWNYGPPLPGDAVEDGQAGPSGSGAIVIDGDEDDGEVQFVERPAAPPDASSKVEDSSIDLTEELDEKVEIKEEIKPKAEIEGSKVEEAAIDLTMDVKPKEEEKPSSPLLSSLSTRLAKEELVEAVDQGLAAEAKKEESS